MFICPLLVAVMVLPPVIADPRHGPSDWILITSPEAAAAVPKKAGGFLLQLPQPPNAVSQAWLDAVVQLAAGKLPVVCLGSAPPPETLFPYLEGIAVDPSPAVGDISSLASRLNGLPLVVPAKDAGQAVALLAAGAGSVLVGEPSPTWAAELVNLLPESVPAMGPGGELATALRGGDMATVIGLPSGFAGGSVVLAADWYGKATLFIDPPQNIALRRRGRTMIADLPALPAGGLLIALRQVDDSSAFASLQVSGERLPTAEEVLARQQRVAARQLRLAPHWQAEQRLLVRVWVEQLARSFEVVLEGPAFWESGVGTDWEIARAWVDGVAWDPDRLPDLPLLEPKRPAVPPLAVRLASSYHYELAGVVERAGHTCYVLDFTGDTEADGARRKGTAFVDKESFVLIELVTSAENLKGAVRSSRSVTSFSAVGLAGESIWLPDKVVVDDLVSAFGGTATVHREVTLVKMQPAADKFAGERLAAWARPNRMLRDSPQGVAPLVPDGSGGRVVGSDTTPAQRFLLAGVVWDPGLSTPVPFGGLQIQDFNFRGRDNQLRLLIAGVINDGALSLRRGKSDLTVRAFMQALPFASSILVRGDEMKGEEIRSRRQRIGGSVATAMGRVRLLADVGADYLDFATTDNTDDRFVLPRDTWEGVVRVEGQASLGALTLSLTGEGGWRQRWRAWGVDGMEKPERSWQRGRLAAVWEKAVFPLAKLHLDAEVISGRNLDRFSSPAPGRFAGVRLRGIASNQVLPERLAAVRASLSLPLSMRFRGEIGADVAWVRDSRSGYRARPLAGVGFGFTTPGPWGTLMQGAIGFPLVTPGKRSPTFEIFLLRPLARSKKT